MKAKFFISIFIYSVLCISGVANANQGMPRVFVVPFQTAGTDSPGLIGHRITDILQQNLSFRSGTIDLVTEQTLAAEAAYTGGPGQTAMRLEVARQKVRMASDLIKTRKYQEAVVELNTASLLYEKNLPYIDDYGELLDVYLNLATAANRMNNDQLENESLSLAIRMEPNLDVAARGFPALMKSTQRIKGLQTKLPTGNLRIASSPSTATVFVNGKERGQTPAEISSLPMGDHFVRIVRPNSGIWSMKVQVLPGNNKIEVVMPPPGQVVGPDIDVEVDELGIDSVMEKLSALLNRGVADASLKNAAFDATIRTNTSHLVLGYLAQTDAGYTVQPILYSATHKQAVYLSLLELDSFMTNVTAQSNMLTEEIITAIRQWPTSREKFVPDVSAPPPWVVAALNPVPAKPKTSSYSQSMPQAPAQAPAQAQVQAPAPVIQVQPQWQGQPQGSQTATQAPAPVIYGPGTGATAAPQPTGPSQYQGQAASSGSRSQQPQPQQPQQQLGSPWGQIPQQAPNQVVQGPATYSPPQPQPQQAAQYPGYRNDAPAANQNLPVDSVEYALLAWSGVDVGPMPPWASPAIATTGDSGAMPWGFYGNSGGSGWQNSDSQSRSTGDSQTSNRLFSSDSSSEWYKRWYVWAAGALVLGGATAAGILLAGPSSDPGASSVSVQW